jgi:hypothetical protein
MATLRAWLTEAGFNFDTGIIVYHDTDEVYWSDYVISRQVIRKDHPIIDMEFDDGYGRPECPNIVAFDGPFMFFPQQYDGATSLVKVSTRFEDYLVEGSSTPYPGGW